MKVYENQRMTDWAISQVGKKMLIEQTRTGLFHASEIYSCFRRTWFNRQEAVQYPKETILKFAVGFAMQEWFFGPEEDGEELNGVIFSPDRVFDPKNIGEFKTTRRSYEKYQKDGTRYLKDLPKIKFDIEANESWIDRTGAYCAEFNINKAHILVFFLFSNELHAWTLEFEDKELVAIRAEIEEKRIALTAAFDTAKKSKGKKLPSVQTRTGDWECRFCPYLDKDIALLKKDGWTEED